MEILADTHILIWYLTGDERLSANARSLIDDKSNSIYYSIVSLWEIAIKHGRKPDKLTISALEFADCCRIQGFNEYALKKQHVFAVDSLYRHEDAPQHKDPFDRLLICQAKTDNLMFITHDDLLPYYNEPCIIIV